MSEPETTPPAVPVPGLRDQIAGAVDATAPMTRGELEEIVASTICCHTRMSPAVQWEIDLLMGAIDKHTANLTERALKAEAEVDVLRRGALERSALLEEARDALSAAGQNGAHGDDWPNIAPGIRALGERAADLTTRARQQAELLEIAEHAGNTAEAARAEAVTVLREVLAQFTQQGHPGAPCLRTPWIRTPTIERWRAALTPPAPADQTRSTT